MTIYGKLAADGTTQTEADECALTGRPVLGAHSVKQQITGTPYYYRYLSDFGYLLTDDKRAELATNAPKKTNVPTPKNEKAKSYDKSSEVEKE